VSALRQALKLVGYGDHDVLKYCLSCFEKSILSAGVQGDCSMSHAITPLFPDNIWFSKALPYPISDQVSPSSESQGEVYVSLYKYVARTAKDLSFEKGERLLILLKQDEDYWFAKSVKSQKVGCIPSNYAIEAKKYTHAHTDKNTHTQLVLGGHNQSRGREATCQLSQGNIPHSNKLVSGLSLPLCERCGGRETLSY
jgi:hypothetical protein